MGNLNHETHTPNFQPSLLATAPVGSKVFAEHWGLYIKISQHWGIPWWFPPDDHSLPFPNDQLAEVATSQEFPGNPTPLRPSDLAIDSYSQAMA